MSTDQPFITFHHPLRTIRKDCVCHRAIKLTVLRGREYVVRDQLDNLRYKKYRSPSITKAAEDRSYPTFEPGMTTIEYVRQFEEMNDLKETPWVGDLYREWQWITVPRVNDNE